MGARTGTLQFFITPEELIEFLKEFVWSQGLVVIAQNFKTKGFVLFGSENSDKMYGDMSADELLLGSILPLSSIAGMPLEQAGKKVSCGEWRTLSIDFPAYGKDRLLLSSFHFRVDPAMCAGGLPDPNSLFKFLKSRLRSRLHRPVWLYSPIDRTPHLVKGVGYTDGVKEFCRNGGVLQQRAGAFFSITEELPPN